MKTSATSLIAILLTLASEVLFAYPCVQQVEDYYFTFPVAQMVFANYTADRWTFYNSCSYNLNAGFCYQSPTSFANGNVYECMSNYPPVPSLGPPYPQANLFLSAAVVSGTHKYVMTCATYNSVCNAALTTFTKCNGQAERCLINLKATQLTP